MKTRVFPTFLLAATLTATACAKHTDREYEAQVAALNDLRAQFDTLTSERDRLNTQLTGLRASNEQMAARLGALGEDVSRLQTTNAQAQSELETARRQQQAAEQRLATFRQMIERFRAMINAGQLRVRIVRGRMVIELPAGILFESGDARLRGQGEEVLRQVATVLRQISDRDFLIAGHTDNVQLGRNGRYHDNWELSSARAVNVVRFLQENGLSPEHLGAAGYAEFQPAQQNDTDEHRQLNRRVEIVLMPNINELPDMSGLDQSSSASPSPAPAPASGPGSASAPAPATTPAPARPAPAPARTP